MTLDLSHFQNYLKLQYFQILHAKGLILVDDIYQDEPPVDYWPEKPVKVHPLEKVLPSVGRFLAGCTAVGAVAIALVVSRL